ncbi:MAG: TldD/PmbA family protein [Nitrospira sp.]|nr:TldD/PmbA family protein [Candidatus Manganitrophaceae bacterium]HIL34970.1 TldD/PmbA family protein [Candidatus Manganitrophaceae bacterium]
MTRKDAMTFSIDEAQSLLRKAEKQGATGGDIVVVIGDAFSTQVRLNTVENISNARGKRLGLRLMFGKRSAMTSTSDLSSSSLDKLLSDTCALARIAAEDPFRGLPQPDEYAVKFPALNMKDPDIGALSIDEKIDLAMRAEKAALEVDERLSNSDGGDFSHHQGSVLYVTSNGFTGTYQSCSASLSVVPIATQDGRMQRDYWYSSKRRSGHLESPESIGRKAAQRTLRRLGGRTVSTQKVPIVFDAEVAGGLIGHLASAASGYAIYKDASFLCNQLNQRIASEAVTIYDDPTLPDALGSRPFDGEGLPSRKKMILEKGIFKSYLLDTYSGKKLGLPSTGNAVRGAGSPPSAGSSNFHLVPGKYTQDEIIRSVDSGFFVTELIGFGINMVTGDYSRGATGIWIEKGELTYPVEEVTIAGNLKDMYREIEMVGNDLDIDRSTAAPTLKISQMMVAGH